MSRPSTPEPRPPTSTQADDYADWSRHYDLLLEPLLRPTRLALRRLVDRCGPRRALDLGCGTGRQIANMFHHPGVFGLDLSMGMLTRARAQAPGRCVRADATRAPFPDASFELVYCQFALHEKPRPIVDSVLSEARRLLTPTGQLVVVDFALSPKRGPWAKLCGWGIHTIERRAGGEHYRSYLDWMSRGGLNAVLEEAGWSLLSAEGFYGGCVCLARFRCGPQHTGRK